MCEAYTVLYVYTIDICASFVRAGRAAASFDDDDDGESWWRRMKNWFVDRRGSAGEYVHRYSLYFFFSFCVI